MDCSPRKKALVETWRQWMFDCITFVCMRLQYNKPIHRTWYLSCFHGLMHEAATGRRNQLLFSWREQSYITNLLTEPWYLSCFHGLMHEAATGRRNQSLFAKQVQTYKTNLFTEPWFLSCFHGLMHEAATGSRNQLLFAKQEQ